jgi:ribosomal protein S18 acetylase RimI-like enzyme
MIDNPVWEALTSAHAHLAIGGSRLKRYPDAVAPFLAVARAGESLDEELFELVRPGEIFYFVGLAPKLPLSWSIEPSVVLQMRCDTPIEPGRETGEVLTLGPQDLDDMLRLTAIAYPMFFRVRTMELGTYLGVRADGRLVAMAGERMRITGYQEISAICTHPDHRSRGYARQLTAPLVNRQLERDCVPFLHVSASNMHAIGLYGHWGFNRTRELDMWKVQRPGGTN